MENYKVTCELFQCRWQYLDRGQFKDYDDTNHATIESAFQAGNKEVKIRRNYSRYTIDFKTKKEKTHYSDNTTVRRWVKFSMEELREYRNNADREFFMGKGGKNANGAKIRALFKKYIDEDYDADEDDEPYIGQDGIISISEKIGINAAEDIEILVLSWLMDCTEMGCWTEKEFYLGLSRLKCSSLAQVKKKVKSLKPMIATEKKYKEFYLWCFQYFKNSAQKGLVLEMAAAAWGLILKGRCPLLPELLEFMEDYDRGVSLDTWSMMLEFSRTVKRDLTGWVELYPPFFDDFVEWLEEEKDIVPPDADS